MTIARAQRLILERLGNGATVMLALLVDADLALADGPDAAGRSVVLVGRHLLGTGSDADAAAQAVLAALAEGEVPAGVHAVAFAPRASAGIALAVEGDADEVLLHGPRGTGKTQAVPAAFAILAEHHARAGYPLPLHALWLHSAIVNADAKTRPSLEAAHWGELWTVRDGGALPVLSLGGTDLVHGRFVGTRDADARERLRAECHVIGAEELVPSLDDVGGIEERAYELALTSRRLPTRRRVAISTTNPGGPDAWPYRRFIAGEKPGCVAVALPASDRLTAEERAALESAFRDSPDLKQRLALGEWVELQIGEAVTPAFRDEHVSPSRLRPVANVMLWLGHDGGHTPTTIIGAHYRGAVLIYAALSSTKAGTRQHVEQLVRPWLSLHAPWALQHPTELMAHRYDPSMETGEDADIDADPVRVLRELLGGRMQAGPVSWPGRLEPVTALLGRFNPVTGRPTLQIDSVDGAPLIRALRGRWHFPTVNGQVSRDLPVKDHPWSDLGDSFAYLVAGIAPARDRSQRTKPRGRSKIGFDLSTYTSSFRGRDQ